MVKAVCLLSGGMDSTTALAVALVDNAPEDVLGLSFNYGQRHREQELGSAADIAIFYDIHHEIVNLQSLTGLLGGSSLTDNSIAVPYGHYTAETMKITVVPNRNAIMLAIAFGVARAAQARAVYIGAHAGDHAIYPDCRSAFMQAFQECMDRANDDLVENTRPILHTPFINRSKGEIVTIGTAIDVPYHLTYSCYEGERLHCGQCGTCVERREAFELAGVLDPTDYAKVETV